MRWRRHPGADRSGGRARAAAEAATLARASPGRCLWPSLRRQPRRCLPHGKAGGPTDGRRACGPWASIPTARRSSTCRSRAATTSSATGPMAPIRGRCATSGWRWRKGTWRAACCRSIKHIPGHGRATKDSHLDLPVVSASRAELESTDFAAFRRLAHLPAAMTAHVVFEAIDPDAAGQHFGPRDGRDHPRRDRLRRPPDERRSRHEGAVGQHRASGRRPSSRPGRTWRWCAAATWPIARPWPPWCPSSNVPHATGSSAPVPFSGNSSPSTLPRLKLALRWRCAPRPESV